MKNHKKFVALRVSAAMRCISYLGSESSIAKIISKGFFLGLLVAGFSVHKTFAADEIAQLPNQINSSSAHKNSTFSATTESELLVLHRPNLADFEQESASQDARQVADWVVDSGDNHNMPFVIVDKIDAKVFVFNADGRLRSAAPALIGLAHGDDAVPGIGDRPLASIRPEERTTPAGRFVAALDYNSHGHVILWVDYDNAISLHPVLTTNPAERRAQRLATATPLDNRITYGCINVPAKFFEKVVRPAFTGTNGIVYVLPETRSTQKTFGSYDVDEHTQRQSASRRLSAQVVF